MIALSKENPYDLPDENVDELEPQVNKGSVWSMQAQWVASWVSSLIPKLSPNICFSLALHVSDLQSLCVKDHTVLCRWIILMRFL